MSAYRVCDMDFELLRNNSCMTDMGTCTVKSDLSFTVDEAKMLFQVQLTWKFPTHVQGNQENEVFNISKARHESIKLLQLRWRYDMIFWVGSTYNSRLIAWFEQRNSLCKHSEPAGWYQDSSSSTYIMFNYFSMQAVHIQISLMANLKAKGPHFLSL